MCFYNFSLNNSKRISQEKDNRPRKTRNLQDLRNRTEKGGADYMIIQISLSKKSKK